MYAKVLKCEVQTVLNKTLYKKCILQLNVNDIYFDLILFDFYFVLFYLFLFYFILFIFYFVFIFKTCKLPFMGSIIYSRL